LVHKDIVYNGSGKDSIRPSISEDQKKFLKLQKKKISCSHKGCLNFFKTNKLKILHHNSNDPECSDEKYDILELIKKFRDYLCNFCQSNKIGFNIFGDWEEYKALKNNLQEFKSTYGDKEKLISLFSDSMNEFGDI
jgi:hypothetical protein